MHCLAFHSSVFSHNYNRLESAQSMGNCASAIILNVANLFSIGSDGSLRSPAVRYERRRLTPKSMTFSNSPLSIENDFVSPIVTYFNQLHHYHIASNLVLAYIDRHQILLSSRALRRFRVSWLHQNFTTFSSSSPSRSFCCGPLSCDSFPWSIDN